jgi:dihydrofolate reductase
MELRSKSGLLSQKHRVSGVHFGLVDEYHLLIHPVILGNGKPLFKGMSERHTLKLIRTEVFTNGVVLLRYEPLSE